jgi:hypothetical protein
MSTALVPQSPPQFVPRDETLNNVRAVARLMDTAVVIPGTNFRVGLDVILGLIPGIGDLISAAVSTYIILAAVKLGVPRAVIARMLLNVGTDAVVGAVPIAGDVFDAAWRANKRNADLLEQALAEPQKARRASLWVLLGVVAAVVLMVAGGVALTYLLIKSLS